MDVFSFVGDVELIAGPLVGRQGIVAFHHVGIYTGEQLVVLLVFGRDGKAADFF